MAINNAVSLHQGESTVIEIDLPAGTSIAGWTIQFVVKASWASATQLILKSTGLGSVTVSDPGPATPKIAVAFVPVDTAALPLADYVQSTSRVDGTTNTYPLAGGPFSVTPPTVN